MKLPSFLILVLATSVCQSTAIPAPPHLPVGDSLYALSHESVRSPLSASETARSTTCNANWTGPKPMEVIMEALKSDFDTWMKKHNGCDFDDGSMMIWDGESFCGKADMEKQLMSLVPNKYYPVSVSPQECGQDGGFIIFIRGYVVFELIRLDFMVTVIFTYTGVVRNFYYSPY